ncbi:PP2C family protein-serine/threonine phosphatase [Haloarcula sediminis]|uniref:PP2C family protein-serine/threonine phosphatase n=1 Tax=Haloarcula sediminis TaxID=3111777 RepID=UPI002D79F703|nr:protein phosphatase 2C domain-containing protein [Haloarcula sp. CK38]
MRYTTNYDIGDRKRGQGINEDSLSVTVFEQGHRDGYLGKTRPPRIRERAAGGEGGEPPSDDDAPADGQAGADPADVAAAIGEAEADDETDDDAPGDEAGASGSAATDDEQAELPANRSAGVFVLADGAGGHDAGDAASYIATTVVAENLAPVAINAVRSHPEEFDIDISPDVLPEPLGPEDIQTGLENAIIKAHREIIRYADESGTQSYTTVVAGVYADGRLHLGWVGDSRAYLVNDAREEIVPLTKDHAVVEEWADEGEIDDVEAHVHPDGNQITRALGGSGHEDPDRAMVEVDTRSVRLFAEDTVLATSDGLIDAQTDAPELYEEYVEADRSAEMAETVRDAVVTDEEIRDVLLSADSLDDAAAEYVTLANERGGKDNISVLLFEDETLPETPSGGVPVRAADPDVDLSDRDTVIITEE